MTTFAMPVQQFTSSPSQYTLYNPHPPSHSQISPSNSGNATPNNSSPTSPRTSTNLPPHLPAHTRQLRPPKSPLYVPAVLRPTDPPKRIARQSPLTPPSSKDSSFDELDGGLKRRGTVDSGKAGLSGLGTVEESEWSTEGLGRVEGSPTRVHWKADSSSPLCDAPTCHRRFTYFTRRHHCRRCGNIFCDLHSPYTIPLDQDANYHPSGLKVRSCEHCFVDFRRWTVARSSRSNSESSDINEPATPTTCGKRGSVLGGLLGGGKDGAEGSLARSVPRDWNWSTF